MGRVCALLRGVRQLVHCGAGDVMTAGSKLGVLPSLVAAHAVRLCRKSGMPTLCEGSGATEEELWRSVDAHGGADVADESGLWRLDAVGGRRCEVRVWGLARACVDEWRRGRGGGADGGEEELEAMWTELEAHVPTWLAEAGGGAAE